MSESHPESNDSMSKRKKAGLYMAMGFGGLLITWAYFVLQELRP